MSWLTGISSTVWIALAVFAAGCVAGAVPAWKYQGARLEAEKAHYAMFVAQTKAEGEAAQKAAKAREVADQQRKEEADHENSDALATLAGTIGRLRHANDAARRIVPAAPAASRRPDLACFDRIELERALGNFLAEARGLVDQGSTCTVNLDTAKIWAQRGAKAGKNVQ